MNEHPRFLSATLAAAMLCAAAPAVRAEAPPAPNKIAAVEVSGGRIFVRGSAKPDFTAFKLADPVRVVIDLAGADVSGLSSPTDVHKDGIAGVTLAQFNEGQARVGRVVIALEDEARYDVAARGNDLVVTVGADKPATAISTPTSGATSNTTSTSNPTAAAASQDANVVASREERRDVKSPAHRLRAVSIEGTGDAALVTLAADGPLARVGIVELKAPARLALDLHGLSVAHLRGAVGAGPVKGVRIARRDDGVRVVIDGAGERMPRFEIEHRADGFRVRLGGAVAAKTRANESDSPRVKPHVPAALPSKLVDVRTVDLRTAGGETRVFVALDEPVQYEVTRTDATTAVLTLHGAVLPERLERNLDASALGGPVKMLSSYRVPGAPGEVKIVALLRAATADAIDAQRGVLTWKFGGPQQAAPATRAAARAGAMASEVRAATTSAAFDERNYSGRRADFVAKDVDIRNLLGAIADISKRNIIVADDVKGTVTIKLRNVPWDQALDIILKSKGLGREDIGNIIRVAPIQTLRQEQKEAAESAKNSLALQPLKVRLIPVNYATAAAMVDKLKDTLTERGTVSVDTRTNTLIVKDVQDALLRAEGIVRNLDTQTPEVLIESRIVEASTSFSRTVGIQWGGNVSFAPTTGNPTGLVFPNIVQFAGAADDTGAPLGGLNGVTQPNFAVNMPAPIGLNNGAGIGFVFGSAGGAANLNLRLSAAENSGTIKTISSPRAVMLDNVESSIGQGVSIPYAQTSAAGVNTTFIEARLELRVTPHVTQEGSIQLKVQVTNNQPNPGLTGANGQPSITRREAKTEVLVKDGDTTVIGGIYTRRNSEAFNEVPLLSRIPVLGWLFKKKALTDDRTELLIFISPRIVNRSQSLVAAGSAGDEKQ